ncbi:MAG: stalk domain-containing protein [Paenibacillus sp.]|uniref:stalk domain-containing protein n=1 Tax=Paenibacillus sp. TaxID=58172 RepID=UPI0029121771|nr:stalk domain-containing protein [Paenibacillus sp.]MDU4695293.1 stalk domain-containing protein [Paenibacillus sp.]
MKNNMKKSIVAFAVVGMTLTGAAGVYAGTQMQKINAYLNHQISIQVDGKTYAPVDGQGRQLAPITYNGSTYLPVRALADVLKVPVNYDAKNNRVQIGGKSPETPEAPDTNISLISAAYTKAQLEEIRKAFAKFESFETPYAPQQMSQGDTFKMVGASEDGVNLIFNHMTVTVSPRDYAYGYEGKTITLSNGVKAKWYTPSETPMLSFQLDDRFVTLSSPDGKLSNTQLEKVAVTVAKLK